MGNLAQKEQLKKIGTQLGEERQKKSVSLEEIAAKTYIPQRLLSAIEEANLDRLPEPVFIQGFIRRYADAIGLDGTKLSKEFTVDLSPLPAPTAAALISSSIETPPLKPVVQQAPRPVPQVSKPVQLPEPVQISEPVPSPPASTAPEPVLIRDEPKRSIHSEAPARLPLIALGGAIGLGVIGILAASLLNRPVERPAQVAAPAPNPVAPPAVTQPKSVVPSPTPAGINVKMNVTEDSWVEVLVDGKQDFEGTLPKGTQRTWNGKERVAVTAGNAGGVSISYSNAPFKPLGASGEVQSATFPPTP